MTIELSDSDIKTILYYVKNNKTIEEISKIYKESNQLIEKKLLSIGYKLNYIYDFDIKIISNKINIPINKICEFINNKNLDINLEKINKESNKNDILLLNDLEKELIDHSGRYYLMQQKAMASMKKALTFRLNWVSCWEKNLPCAKV